jgi:outer membrane biogenesis lipoprotein LolB
VSKFRIGRCHDSIKRLQARLTAPLLAISLIISGCAKLPLSPPVEAHQATPPTCIERNGPLTFTDNDPRLQGQISVKVSTHLEQAARGISLGFFYQGNDQSGQIDLMTLMGSQIAQVSWQDQCAWLDKDQTRQSFSSLDELSLNALGEVLPLRALSYWMQGLPAPFMPSQIGNQAGQFEQAGWLVDTREQTQQRLQAQRPASATQGAVLIKIHLDR